MSAFGGGGCVAVVMEEPESGLANGGVADRTRAFIKVRNGDALCAHGTHGHTGFQWIAGQGGRRAVVSQRRLTGQRVDEGPLSTLVRTGATTRQAPRHSCSGDCG